MRHDFKFWLAAAILLIHASNSIYMETKPEDGLSLEKFTWKIADISSKLDTKKDVMLKSECFLIGGYLWRIILGCTKGNGVNIVKLSLEVPDASYFSVGFGWARDVTFSLAVIDQIHGTFTIRKEMKYLFNAKERKYEFSPFINLSELCDSKKGYLVKNTCVIEACILVSHAVDPQKSNLFTFVKVVQDKHLLEQIGTYIYFDLVNFGQVPAGYCVHNWTPFNLFKEMIGNELGFAPQIMRFWRWAAFPNNTIRPYQLLTQQEESLTIEMLKSGQRNLGGAELWLSLEVQLGMDTRPISLPPKTRLDVLLFFKLYDPAKEELRYAGRLILKGTAKPIDTLAQINKMVGFSPDEEIELYKELEFEPDVKCERVSKTLSYFSSKIKDGDIICFQKSHATDCRFLDVPSFLKYVHNRQMVHFVSLKRPKEDEFFLELSKTHSYEDVVERVANRLGLDDPSGIRLTSHNCLTQQPNIDPIGYRSVSNLMGMLVLFNQTSDILYYEVLDIPWPELQDPRSVQVALHHAQRNEVVIHNIKMPKNSTLRDLMNQLKSKVELSHPDAELRLLEVSSHKIHKIYPHNENIENLNDEYCRLHAAEIPEERNLGPLDIWIHVCHFFKETSHNQMEIKCFGEPFVLAIHEGETLVEVKVRIQRKLLVPEKDFRKWKYAFISSVGLPEYLNLKDSDVLSNRFQKKDVCSWDQILGLEHSPNDAPRKLYAAHQTEKVSSWDQNLGLDNSVDDGPVKDYEADQVDAADYTLKEAEEVPEHPISNELVDFRGLAKIDRDFVPLLEEVCSWHPHLIECQQKKSATYNHWAFTALGRVLHFLKTRKAKDMKENACQELQVLWEELETFRFELAWLKPHVERALSMKNYIQKAKRIRRLKDSVTATEMKKRKLSAELNVEELNLEVTKRELEKAEEDFEERNLDAELGYGSH